MSVFNSSVTGGCSFSVSKEHVNKQAELFKSENQLTHAGRPHTLSSSPSSIISGREGTEGGWKMSFVQVQIFDWAEPSGSFYYIHMQINSGFGDAHVSGHKAVWVGGQGVKNRGIESQDVARCGGKEMRNNTLIHWEVDTFWILQ